MIKLESPALQADSLPSEPPGEPCAWLMMTQKPNMHSQSCRCSTGWVRWEHWMISAIASYLKLLFFKKQFISVSTHFSLSSCISILKIPILGHSFPQNPSAILKDRTQISHPAYNMLSNYSFPLNYSPMSSMNTYNCSVPQNCALPTLSLCFSCRLPLKLSAL